MDGSPSGKGTVPVTRNATPSKFCTPPHRLSTASLSGVARCWHSNAYSSLFSSLFFFDFHRTNFSRFRRTFHSFDPVGFATFANPAPPQPNGSKGSSGRIELLIWNAILVWNTLVVLKARPLFRGTR